MTRSSDVFALVGIGCRFPGATGPERFWKLLRDGVDAVCEVPPDRWHIASLFDADATTPGKINQRHGGFIDDIRGFDAAFFGVSPKEAARIDPQQRLLLEVAYHALEDAGISGFGLARSPTGVFVGISTHDYSSLQTRACEVKDSSSHTSHGGALSIAANRISYVFDLRGPSLAVDTACSSTLSALHVALGALRQGDCTLALVGGVNALLRPEPVVGFSKAMMLSTRGRCQAFSAHADGFVRAEGAGMVVLKPLEAALADGDRVYAVVRATGLNEDGRTVGMALPNADAQQALLERVYREAGVDPRDVGYIEAHGTGTIAGDAAEASALGAVMGKGRNSERPCLIGSVKTNIGHLEAGAGAAGLIKAALALYHRELPPSLHAEVLSPKIPFAELGLQVVRERRAWPTWNTPALAGVNSFGFGGANAHALLQAPPSRADETRGREGAVLFALSARSDGALSASAQAAAAQGECSALADLAYTSLSRRDRHPLRACVVAHTHGEWRERLRALAAGAPAKGVTTGRVRDNRGRIAFVFCGQGPQWWAMGRELFSQDEIFRTAIDEVDAALSRFAPWRLREEMFERAEERSRIHQTWLTQPALFALQIALARRWRSLGVEPAAVVGHSVGEVAALVIAGALSLEAGCEIIFHRSRIQHAAAGKGKMLAVGLGERELRRRLGGEKRVQIAAVNRPELAVLSGDAEAIEAISAALATDGVFHREVEVDVAFHSHHMDTLEQPLEQHLGHIRPVDGPVDYFSTVFGRKALPSELGSDYWFQNVRDPVLFVHAVRAMIRDGCRCFIELGPHPILAPGIDELLREAGVEGDIVPSLRRGENESETLLGGAAQLFVNGYHVGPALPGRFVSLPNYPWQRQQWWSESEEGRRERLHEAVHPLVTRSELSGRDEGFHRFALEFDGRIERWLGDHVVQGQLVCPAAALFEAVLAAGRCAFSQTLDLEDVSIDRPSFLSSEDDPVSYSLELSADHGEFTLISRRREEATSQVRGVLRRGQRFPSQPIDFAPTLDRLDPIADGTTLYPALEARGLQFGANFQTLGAMRGRVTHTGQLELVGDVEVRASLDQTRYGLHPVALDACFQLLCGCALLAPERSARVYLPVGVARLRTQHARGLRYRAYARVRELSPQRVVADVWLCNREDGAVVAEAQGFEGQALDRVEDSDRHLYDLSWRPQDRLDQKVNRCSVEVLCAWATLTERLRARADDLANDPAHLRRAKFDIACEPLLREHVMSVMRELGISFIPGSRISDAFPNVSRLRHHRRLLSRLLDALVDFGVLVRDGDGYRVLAAPPSVDTVTVAADLGREPGTEHELALIACAGGYLARVLTGSIDGAQVLLAPDMARHLEGAYRHSYDLRYAVELATTAFRTLVSRLPDDRTLRILEVGGGTASLAAELLPLVPRDRCDYVFSDISPSFFEAARQKLAAFPHVTFSVLDLEQPVVAQGFARASFDIVIAHDVLHATRNVREAVDHVADLLGDGGAFLMIEVTRPRLTFDLIFGMTEGWWRFEDEPLRRTHASLSNEAWLELLPQHGFAIVTSATYATDARHHVFVAQREARPERAEGAHPSGTVLLVAGDSAHGRTLAERFAIHGLNVVRAEAGDAANMIANASAPLRAIVFATALSSSELLQHADDLAGVQARTLMPMVDTLRAAARLAPSPRFVIVTAGAWAKARGDTVDVAQSPVWGIGRTAASEYPQMPLRMVDVSATPCMEELDGVVRECVDPTPETDVLLRGERRFVLHIDAATPHTAQARPPQSGDEQFCLEIRQPGLLDSLAFHVHERVSLAAHEVEIEVAYAGLNFKDVMRAMGLAPRAVDARLFGLECSGRVSRIGGAVADLKPGDEVMATLVSAAPDAMSPLAFSRFAVTPRAWVVRKPPSLTLAEASTFPIAFETAWYSLTHLAHLQRDENVLIHSATGGVGLAAIQLARSVDARIFATAGSDAKRSYLRSMGIADVFDSRTFAWADEIRTASGGKGIDVVLNTLSGRGLTLGLEALAPSGRFVDISIADVYRNRRVGLAPFRHNTSYFALQLDVLALGRPDWFGTHVVEKLGGMLTEGKLAPLPATVVPARDVAHAFGLMARSQHIGKIVVDFGNASALPVVPARRRFGLKNDKTYLVTGGNRGLGFRLAAWLIERGARHVVLLSKTGALEASAAQRIAHWRASGVRVENLEIDVADAQALAAALAALRRTLPPIGGVIHGAMVLADVSLETLDADKLARVLGPKAGGALNLDALTRDDPLDFFVLLSSFASLAGTRGQANYNAANAMLEALAWRRVASGMPATVVNLGHIAEVGFVARHKPLGVYLEDLGLDRTPPDVVMALLERTLQAGTVQALIGVGNWNRLALMLPMAKPRFRFLCSGSVETSDRGVSAQELAQLAPAERVARVLAALTAAMARIAGANPGDVQPDARLTELGLDSLMATQLSRWIGSTLGVNVPTMRLLKGPSLAALAAELAAALTPN